MRLFLLLLGNDAPAVDRAVAVIRSLHDTRRRAAHHALLALAVAALIANTLALAVIAGAGQ